MANYANGIVEIRGKKKDLNRFVGRETAKINDTSFIKCIPRSYIEECRRCDIYLEYYLSVERDFKIEDILKICAKYNLEFFVQVVDTCANLIHMSKVVNDRVELDYKGKLWDF